MTTDRTTAISGLRNSTSGERSTTTRRGRVPADPARLLREHLGGGEEARHQRDGVDPRQQVVVPKAWRALPSAGAAPRVDGSTPRPDREEPRRQGARAHGGQDREPGADQAEDLR